MSVRTLALLLCLMVAACSGGLYDFDDGGSSGGNVKVEGTLTGIADNDTDRDVVVFVYTGICETEKADEDLCADLLLPEDLPLLNDKDYEHMKKVVVKADALGDFFKVKSVKKGNLTIAYLQDKAKGADRKIDEEDITITRDAMNNIIPAADNAVSMQANDGRLDDVEKKATVELNDVAVDFPSAAAVSSSASSSTSTTTSTYFGTFTMPKPAYDFASVDHNDTPRVVSARTDRVDDAPPGERVPTKAPAAIAKSVGPGSSRLPNGRNGADGGSKKR